MTPVEIRHFHLFAGSRDCTPGGLSRLPTRAVHARQVAASRDLAAGLAENYATNDAGEMLAELLGVSSAGEGHSALRCGSASTVSRVPGINRTAPERQAYRRATQ